MSKRLLLSTLLLLSTFMLSSQVKDPDKEAYIKKYHDIAMHQMIQYNIPASITLAQGIFESASGKSVLATKGNNHFGIKCHEWTGKKIYHDDDAKHECFRKYKNADESYEDHSIFLTTRDRYKGLFELDILDYKGWAYGLKKAGYATNPKYPERLIELIETYQLYKYDEYVMGLITEEELQNITPHISSKVKKEIEYEYDNDEIFNNSKFLHFTPGTCDCMNEAIFIELYSNRGIYAYKGISCTFVEKGETLADIAKSVKMSKHRLLKYNDLPRKAEVEYEDIIYLDYKNKRAKEKQHRVVYPNETLWSISQCYAVKIKKLIKENPQVTNINEPLRVGQIIRLR